MKRLRLGILLIIVSWLPIAQVGIWVAHNNGRLISGDASNEFRLAIWGVQIMIGFVGLWLAGKVAVESAKHDGWKNTPSNLWRLFRHGPPPESA
jgi:hypothetical protein